MTEEQIIKEFYLIIQHNQPAETNKEKEKYIDPSFDEWDNASEKSGEIEEEIE